MKNTSRPVFDAQKTIDEIDFNYLLQFKSLLSELWAEAAPVMIIFTVLWEVNLWLSKNIWNQF